jgi:hypothetical protein
MDEQVVLGCRVLDTALYDVLSIRVRRSGIDLYVYLSRCEIRVPAGVKGWLDRLLIHFWIQTVGEFPSPRLYCNADLESHSQCESGLSIICKLASQYTPTGTFQHNQGIACGQA